MSWSEEDCFRADEIALSHVEWLLEIIKPLLIAEFVHGYKHGIDEKGKDHEEII